MTFLNEMYFLIYYVFDRSLFDFSKSGLDSWGAQNPHEGAIGQNGWRDRIPPWRYRATLAATMVLERGYDTAAPCLQL